MLDIKPLKRQFMPDDFTVTTWDALKPYADDLVNRPIESLGDYQKYLRDENEFNIIVSEDAAWRMIRMTCNTDNKEFEKAYDDFNNNISPPLQEYADKLSRRIVESPFAAQMNEPGFAISQRRLKDGIQLFRQENIALGTEEQEKLKHVTQLRGAMTVTLDGAEITLPKAADRLFWLDRAKREEAWMASRTRLDADRDNLDAAFDHVFNLRQKAAKNAGFENYLDYKFAEMNRYDYTPKDCEAFHAGVEKAVVPLVAELQKIRKKDLGVDVLRPWDMSVDTKGLSPLKAFESAEDLADKTIAMFYKVDPVFGDTFQIMKDKGRLDLGSRKGKQPGGYMMPMYESSIPFVFANVTEKVGDLVTNIHEGGHAVHEILMRNLSRMAYRNYPSEIAELGSMTMELITMDNWDVFFKDEKECARAKFEHLEDIIGIFPWIAQVDAFQHQLYTDKTPSMENRHVIWSGLNARFNNGCVEDWSGMEHFRRSHWHRQIHIFDYPLYYIEYGMAQLGALQIWRNSKQDKKQAIDQYKNALSLGYTKSIPEVYETAGIKFDFSQNMVGDLMNFVGAEMKKLKPV